MIFQQKNLSPVLLPPLFPALLGLGPADESLGQLGRGPRHQRAELLEKVLAQRSAILKVGGAEENAEPKAAEIEVGQHEAQLVHGVDGTEVGLKEG